MTLFVTLRSVGLLNLVETSFVCLNFRKVGRGMQGNRFVSEGHGCHVPAKMKRGGEELEALAPWYHFPASNMSNRHLVGILAALGPSQH